MNANSNIARFVPTAILASWASDLNDWYDSEPRSITATDDNDNEVPYIDVFLCDDNGNFKPDLDTSDREQLCDAVVTGRG